MGQYYLVVNKTKREYLYPHVFGDGLKAFEIIANGDTLKALGVLLLKSDGGGGGDLKAQRDENNPLIGRWVDDEIVIIGDYDSSGLYNTADEDYTDISYHVYMLLVAEKIIDLPERGTYAWDRLEEYKREKKPLPDLNNEFKEIPVNTPVKKPSMFIEPEGV